MGGKSAPHFTQELDALSNFSTAGCFGPCEDFNATHPVTIAKTPITRSDNAPKEVTLKPRLEYAGTILVELFVVELVTV